MSLLNWKINHITTVLYLLSPISPTAHKIVVCQQCQSCQHEEPCIDMHKDLRVEGTLGTSGAWIEMNRSEQCAGLPRRRRATGHSFQKPHRGKLCNLPEEMGPSHPLPTGSAFASPEAWPRCVFPSSLVSALSRQHWLAICVLVFLLLQHVFQHYP